MESEPNEAPLIVVVGCTASGKSALAYSLAKNFGGEIIAADSRTIYKGLDVGTAKPSLRQRQEIPHHLIDIISPNKTFTVVDFKERAQKAIRHITQKGRRPIVVGGTGLYIDALLFDFSFRKSTSAQFQGQNLEELSVAELQQLLRQHNIALPENTQNPRHLIRTLKTGGEAHYAQTLRSNTIVIGLDVANEMLKARIKDRTTAMFEKGLEAEAKALAQHYGWSAPAVDTIGYKEFRPYFEGDSSLETVQEDIIRHTNAYAKRQRTWFRRNKSIHWLEKQEEAEALITTLLSK